MKLQGSYIIKWIKIPVLALAVMCCILSQPQKVSANETIRVLFIGNSKTYKKNIPGKFASIAKAQGKDVSVTSVTIGGKSLFYIAGKKAKKITAEAYDYVVIQEHTDTSSHYSAFRKGAKAIARLVEKENPDVQIVVRKTWLYCDSLASERKQAYYYAEKIADELGAIVSEDGLAFDICSSLYPSIELFSDRKHQSAAGAYLSACCIYAAIFEESPVGCSYTGGLTAARAKKLQKIAVAVTF
ncbi:MAG: hypothetical protein LIO94_11075 [Clostridiales bacterium]|nr:hypothetical protein [Clostridiales bacterium]